MVNQLVLDLQPRIASSADIQDNINYISDLGRIAPLIGIGLQKEIRDVLFGKKNAGSLLKLKDRMVNSHHQVTTRTLKFDRQIFSQYIEKLVREEGYLSQLVNIAPPDDVHEVSDITDEDDAELANEPNSSPFSLTMGILSGFITALGVAAVAIAFTVFNAATLGIGGLVLAGIGVAAILGGVGLFAGSFKKNEQPSSTDTLAPQLM